MQCVCVVLRVLINVRRYIHWEQYIPGPSPPAGDSDHAAHRRGTKSPFVRAGCMTGAVHAYGGPFPGICDCVCTLLYPKFQSHQVCVIAHALPTSHHPRQSTNAIPAPPRLASPSPNTHRPSPRPARRAPRASPQRGSGCAGYTDFRHMLTVLVHCARRCANRSYFLLIPAPYLPSVYTSVPRPPTARSESGDPTPTPADRCAMRMESHGRPTSIACFTLTVGFSAVAEASHVLDTPPLQLASDHTACPHV